MNESSIPPAPLEERVRTFRASDGRELVVGELTAPGGAPSPSAPVFVLVHGFAQNRRSFTLGRIPETLIDLGARVFVGELRGHGRSVVDAGDAAWGFRTHLEVDCPAILEGVRGWANCDRIHFIGHSMGGMLGYALAGRGAPLASLTALGAPIRPGRTRPIIRAVSVFAGPLAWLAGPRRRIPLDDLLALLSPMLSRADASLPIRALQRVTGLANPALCGTTALREILVGGDPESSTLVFDLASMVVRATPMIEGINLEACVFRARLPIAVVVGTNDFIAPREAVSIFERLGHAGPRRLIEIPDASHVDVVAGDCAARAIRSLVPFLLSA